MSSIGRIEMTTLFDHLQSWKDDYLKCVTSIFQITPDAWQAQALTALNTDDYLSIRSGHGVGKSAWLSWVVWATLWTRYPVKIPCTAPTSHQLKDVLWPELDKWHRRMPTELQRFYEVKSDSVVLRDAPKQSYAVARTSRKERPEALQGFHADNLLFVIDEASGVPDEVFQVAEGALTGLGTKTVMTGNPTRRTGYFADSFFKMSEYWHNIHVSCEHSANVTTRYIERMARKWGRESDVYRVRVKGDFPESDSDALIPLHLIEEAQGRDLIPVGEIIWSADVARFGGNRSVLIKRCRNAVLEAPKVWRGISTMALAGYIKLEWDRTIEEEKPVAIYIDVIGVGAGVVDRLLEQDLPVIAVNVSQSAAAKTEYRNKRAELFYSMAEWFEELMCRLPPLKGTGDEDDQNLEDLYGELGILKRLPPSSNGKLDMPRKEKIAEDLELEDSPDLAEALMLSFQHLFMSNLRIKGNRMYKRRVPGKTTADEVTADIM